MVNQYPQSEHMRASDADRDRAAERLREAMAEGRLTADEHSERLDAIYQAKTVGELVPVTRDLPERSPAAGPNPEGISATTGQAQEMAETSKGQENIVAVFGGAERAGRWLVEPRTNISLLFGGAELDFREAVLSQREVVVQSALLFGGMEVVIPPGVRVVNNTTAIFGGTSMNGADTAADPEAPTIRLTGMLLFGGIDIKVKPAKRKKK